MTDSRLIDDTAWTALLHTRATTPRRIASAYARRQRRNDLVDPSTGTLFLVAADHPARGALGVGDDPRAMTDRRDLLERLATALENSDVDGLLATPDIVEDLLLLSALTGARWLDDRVVIGSMNRGGLAGAVWELDDPFTAYDVRALSEYKLDGGKMLLRVDDDDPRTLPTLTACGHAVSELARAGLLAVVEPLPYTRGADGRAEFDGDPDRLIRAATIASGLGATSAYTWLKVPATAEAGRVMAATSLPCLLLGGVPSADQEVDLAAWTAALRSPNARGLVLGRALLYPPGGDVAGAVAAAARLLDAAQGARATDVDLSTVEA